MKVDKPFRKSFICAAVWLALILIFVAVSDPTNIGPAFLFLLGLFLLIALLTGAWSFISRHTWAWSRFSVTTVGFFFAYLFTAHTIRAVQAALRPR
jgi:hypothetical protein